MLVTLIKALGASNRGKQENKIPYFVQESVFHHQPISIILIFRFYVPSDLCFSVLDPMRQHHHIVTDISHGPIVLG